MKNTDYVDLINFEDEFDLCDTVSETAEIKKVSIISDSSLIEDVFNILVNKDSFNFVRIQLDSNDTETPYIMLLNDRDLSILPLTDINNDLLKLSDKVYIDIETSNSKLVSDYIDNNINITLFAIGANIDVNDIDEDIDNSDEVKKIDFNIKVNIDVADKEFSESDGSLYSFTINKNSENDYESFSYCSSKELTDDKIQKLLKKFRF